MLFSSVLVPIFFIKFVLGLFSNYLSCEDLEMRVGQHSTVVSDLQPQLQQIWQEELDRVRRQQVLFREKVGYIQH